MYVLCHLLQDPYTDHLAEEQPFLAVHPPVKTTRLPAHRIAASGTETTPVAVTSTHDALAYAHLHGGLTSDTWPRRGDTE